MPTEAEAFAALRRGGLLHNDPALVRLFDISDRNFVVEARKSKPELFFDAMTATRGECSARLKEIQAAERQRQRDIAPTPTPGFDARTASDAEYRAELKRLGIRRSSPRGATR